MTDEKMIDPMGTRVKFGVLVPSTNTIVENEFAEMAPAGVSNNTGRFRLDNMALESDADFEKLIDQVKANLDASIDDIVTCEPDYIILGMSAETFWDGLDSSHVLKARLQERAGGRGICLGSEACQAAMQIYRPKRIAVLTPYWPVADKQVRRYFAELGIEIVALTGLKARSPVAIACFEEADLIAALRELNASDPDAIVQVGTNLCLARLAAEAERWFSKPVIAINTAIYRFALRANGIDDKVQGFGSLLSEH